MKAKKIVSLLLCVLMLLFSTESFAYFPDVDTNANISWAKGAINDMANLGYIKGYEDGNFRPYQSVSRIESLILLSRVLGVDEGVNYEIAEYAQNMFSSELRPYSIPYKKEVAFLLYNDVLNVSELAGYISDATKDLKLQRFEAATLLTKLMGGEKEVKNQAMVVSTFKDAAQIPSASKGYVEYVKEHGLMQGMGSDPVTNMPIFEPVTEVTRAQMAVMLNNILSVLDREYQTGNLTYVNQVNGTISISNDGVEHIAELMDNSVIYVDGAAADINRLAKGNSVAITYIYGVPRIIDVRTAKTGDTFEGIMTGSETTNGTLKIIVQDIDNSSVKESYAISSNCVYTLNDNNTYFGDIKTGDYVSGVLSGGKIAQLNAYSKTATVSGTLEYISNEDTPSLSVILSTGISKTYIASVTKKVSVSKNKSNSDLASLTIGDSVTITLEYNRIVRVEATSLTTNVEGTIEEIAISKTPTITIKVGDSSKTYYISSDVSIKLDGETKATIYDLRIGSKIKFKTESQSIISIETTSVASIDKVEGTVVSVESSFRFMNVSVKDAATGEVTVQAVLVDKSASITQVGSTTLKTINDLKTGQTVLCYGSNVTGNFRADTVLIINQPSQ